MKHFVLFVCALMVHYFSYAQHDSTYNSGYLVVERGDTLRGDIQISRFVTENGVLFRSSSDAPYKMYLPSQVRAFGTATGKRFVRRKLILANRTQSATRGPGDTRDSVAIFLQQLTTGAGRLYRLDYNLVPSAGTALEATQRETRFFLVETAASGLLVLEQTNFRPMLRAVFEGCTAALELLPRTKFEETPLVQLALRYGSCAPALPAIDLRPPPSPTNKTRLILGVRAGAACHTLSVDNEPRLARSAAKSLTDWQVGVYMRLSRPNRVASVGVGLQYSQRSTRYSSDYVVPAGFTNANQRLALSSELRLQAVQLPFWVQLGARSGYGFYVGVGAVPAWHRNGRLEYTALQSVVDAGAFLPRAASAQVTEQRFAGGSTLALGGQLTAGVRPRLGTAKVLPVLEVQYERGRELRNDRTLSAAVYDGLTVRLGLEF